VTEQQPNLIQRIERGLQLPDDFLVGLLNERDDWSFVIKTHALIELAVNHALIATLRKPEVSKVIERLELSNQATGKLALIKSLALLDKEHRSFIRWLSELRNHLVHDARNVAFDLDRYGNDLDRKEANLFNKRFGGIFKQPTGDSGVAVGVSQRRAVMWASACAIAGLCYVAKSKEELDAELERYRIESFNNFFDL